MAEAVQGEAIRRRIPGICGFALVAGHWLSAGCAAFGVFLLGAADLRHGRRTGRTILLALSAALCFAWSDAMIQRWSKAFGVFNFLPAMFASLAVQSLLLLLWDRSRGGAPPAGSARRWLLVATGLTAAQAMLISGAIALSGDATGVNVLYNTRGLWSIALVWLAGHRFGNTEAQVLRGRIGWRLAGAVVLMAGVLIAVRAATVRSPG